MKKLKSVLLTEQTLKILKGVQSLKKEYPGLVNYKIIETHLEHTCKEIHEFTLKLKNLDKC